MSYDGAIGNLIGTGLTAGLASREAKKARAWSKRRYAERYQVTMADMKAAGLNPLLAAGMGLGGGGTPGSSMAQMPDFGKVGEQLNTGKRVKNETQTQRVQRELLGAQAGTAKEQARKAGAEADIIAAGQPYADMEREFYTTAAGRAAYFADKFGGAIGALGGGILGGAIGSKIGKRSRTPTKTPPKLPRLTPRNRTHTPRGVPSAKERGFDFNARAEAWRKRNRQRSNK